MTVDNGMIPRFMSKRLQCVLDYRQDLNEYLEKNHPQVVDYRILSQSLDARRGNCGRVPKYQYVLEVIEKGERFEERGESFPHLGDLKVKPIIIGAGPAGLFAALRFAEYGVSSLLFERGDCAHKRMLHIGQHWRYGRFDSENNVCFGEGGAGLFSDGKLITRIKSPYVQYVMNKFVEFGAPRETAYLANPHLGSNKIRQLIGKMTQSLLDKKCHIHYQTRVDKILSEKGRVVGVETQTGERFYSPYVILAVGHSAKEMYHHLKANKIEMRPKDFAVGVRVEHPRELIDQIQYGPFTGDKLLGASRYRLSWEDPHELKGTYSFCMCPGGYVLSSGTDADGLVVNGMSNYARNSPWSNSAVVVSVKAGVDFSTDDVLAGLTFQREIEKVAYQKSLEKASGKEIPAQTLEDFMQGYTKRTLPKTSCPSGVFATPLEDILPAFVTQHLRHSLEIFNERMKGFISSKALCLAPETRTSAPVTIVRDRQSMESLSLAGLYPCGEGAGYAGGITSAAVDGVKVAMKILECEKDFFS